MILNGNQFHDECTKRMHDNNTDLIETDRETYLWMLECVPPVIQRGNAFLNSEPYCHEHDGTPVYSGFNIVDGKYVGRLMTLKEFRELWCNGFDIFYDLKEGDKVKIAYPLTPREHLAATQTYTFVRYTNMGYAVVKELEEGFNPDCLEKINE